jgi:hypothetical protein
MKVDRTSQQITASKIQQPPDRVNSTAISSKAALIVEGERSEFAIMLKTKGCEPFT